MVEKTKSQWYAFDGLNVNYLLDQYDIYLSDKSKVDDSLIPIFKVWDALDNATTIEDTVDNSVAVDIEELAIVVVKIADLIQNIRIHGHRQADIFPLEKREPLKIFELDHYGLDEEDLKEIPATVFNNSPEFEGKSALDLVADLKNVYIADIGYDIGHIDPKEKEWFRQKIEQGFLKEAIDSLDRDKVIDEIFRAEGLEQYLQKYYMGQKRFSIEGLETLMPVMNELVRFAGEDGFNEVYVSMAHRGRLNALVHILDQSYEWLLAKFEGVPYDTGIESEYDKYNSTGDVKYHLGAKTTRQYQTNDVNITMANNPSHLEFVNSVLQGMTRAAQDDRSHAGHSKQDYNKALAIQVHGDAAVVGQGVNYETLNFSNIPAYTTGGAVHIIANNTIGFTTYNNEQFATEYPSDAFKGFGVPVLHLNADHPDSAVAAVKLAYEYRQKFNKDIFINLIGYRRFGHNELDEPRMTNPKMYQLIDNLGTITEVYSDYLIKNGFKTEKDLEVVKEKITDDLEQARQAVKSAAKEAPKMKPLTELVEDKIVELPETETKVDRKRLEKLNNDLLKRPEDFNIHRNLSRVLNKRREVFNDDLVIDWSLGEALAYGTILEDGIPIRLTGEDVERGTFSHRSMVLKDFKTGQNFAPLYHISEGKASFDIHNSTLSETAVTGFEYGYSMTAKDSLVFWEAQFGDFANGSQVIFDQFVSGGRKKWGELSGLVLLLPHGYEGAGPEHSSGRVERFLQLSAENNWTVANVTTSAQLFHLLRRQAKALGKEGIRPLVLMTPKSLLRGEDAAAPISDFTDGKFEAILADKKTKKEASKVKRLVLTSGRLSVDITKHLKEHANEAIAHTRIEELYPFPEKQLIEELKRYENLTEIRWVQEEPKNMGAYAYIAMNILPLIPKGISFDYIGRPAMAAPSEGLPAVHKAEQARIVSDALTI